jgi:CheY-like chemotaxis protein
VVLDLCMPGMDGFEFLERFRRTETEAGAGARTPVIVWTTKDLTPEERERLRVSAEAVVSKKGGGTATLLEVLAVHVRPPGGGAPGRG